MRDGTYVGTWRAEDMTTDDIIAKMVGRELTNVYPSHFSVSAYMALWSITCKGPYFFTGNLPRYKFSPTLVVTKNDRLRSV